MTASVTQYGKAQYLRDLSRNVLRARLSNARAGRWTGNRAPYGYNLDDGKLLLGDDEKIETVRWIFQQYTETSISLHDIAGDLTKRGIASPSGKDRWQMSTIQLILRREAYIGRASQLKESKGKFYTVKDGKISPVDGKLKKPVEDWFYVDCPAIVDAEKFKLAQERIGRGSQGKRIRRKDQRGVLAGLLRCSHCGKPMVAAWGGRTAPKEEKFYQCYTYCQQGKHGCHRNLFRESTAIEFLVPQIQDVVLNPANFGRLTEAIRKEVARRKLSAPANIKDLQGRLAKADAELQVASRELKRVPEDLYDLAVSDAREIKARREAAQDALTTALSQQESVSTDVGSLADKALGGLNRLREQIASVDEEVVRDAFSRLVDRIDLEFEHVQHKKMVRSHFKQGTVQFNSCRLQHSGQPDSSAMQLRFLVGWAAFSRAAGFPSDRFATGSLRCSGYAWDRCC